MFKHVATMSRADKSLRSVRVLLIEFLALACFASCNRMVTPPGAQLLKDAEAKVASGDFLEAITLYERALDNSARAADIHFKLGLLYDEKMNDSLNALHHFKRYLTIAPGGAHANEVKSLMKRDELALVTTLSGDSVVSRAEAARLRNENLELRKELEIRSVQMRSASLAKEKHASIAQPEKGESPSAKKKSGSRSYVVQPGDTLASISRKFYKSSAGWKKIRDEDGNRFDDPGKLKPGQTVTVP